MRLALLLVLVALASIARAVTVVNGEESLFLASASGSAPLFSYSSAGTQLTIRVDPFESGATLGLFCSRNTASPTPTSYQWGISGQRPTLVLPAGTAGYTAGLITCIVQSSLTIQAGFNATEGALTGSLIPGVFSYGYVTYYVPSYYEFRVPSYAKIAGITIEANSPTSSYIVYASVRSARADLLPDWSMSGRSLAISGSSLSSKLATRKLQDRLFVAVKLSTNSAYTISLRLTYSVSTTGIFNGVANAQSLTSGTSSEQAFYSLPITASMKTYPLSLTCTPTSTTTTKLPFMYASFLSLNPSPLSNQWRSEYPSDRQLITITASEMAMALNSAVLYISLISQSTQPAAVSLLALSPAEQPIALVDSAPYRAQFAANIYKYFTLEITSAMVSQTLTVNSTYPGTSFYASMTNLRPDSSYFTWSAPSKPLVIIPADSQYKVGTMYLGIVAPSSTDMTILASTPSQGGSSSILRNGTVTTGVVAQGGYNYYSMVTQTTYVTDVQVLPDRGVAYLYASYQTSTPNIGDFEWASTFNGANGLLLGPGVTGYSNGTLYLSVYGKTACNYKLTAQQYKR